MTRTRVKRHMQVLERFQREEAWPRGGEGAGVHRANRSHVHPE
jgi:hypothetical protein